MSADPATARPAAVTTRRSPAASTSPPASGTALGLLWNPAYGTALQSQSGAVANGSAAWGTLADADRAHEATDLPVAFAVNGDPVTPEPGHRDLPDGDLAVEYSIGDGGRKTLSFGDAGIDVSVRLGGAIVERLPLALRDGDALRLDPGRATVARGPVSFVVTFDAAAMAEAGAAIPIKAAPYRIVPLRITADGRLDYRMAFERT